MKRCALLLPALLALPACRETPPPAGKTTSAAAPPVTATAAPSASAKVEPPPKPRKTWSFDKDRSEEPPAGFDFFASGGKPGKWVVKPEPLAPSAPNVLAQLDEDRTPDRVAMAIAKEPVLKDASVSVRCRTISGKVEQSCGVVLRFADEKNYYLARLSALDREVSLFAVRDGKRRALGGWKGATVGTAWHVLELSAVEEQLRVSWDGTEVWAAKDTSHVDAGRAGVWTRADAVTTFDDLTITGL
jgi:hypothetical protein